MAGLKPAKVICPGRGGAEVQCVKCWKSYLLSSVTSLACALIANCRRWGQYEFFTRRCAAGPQIVQLFQYGIGLKVSWMCICV